MNWHKSQKGIKDGLMSLLYILIDEIAQKRIIAIVFEKG